MATGTVMGTVMATVMATRCDDHARSRAHLPDAGKRLHSLLGRRLNRPTGPRKHRGYRWHAGPNATGCDRRRRCTGPAPQRRRVQLRARQRRAALLGRQRVRAARPRQHHQHRRCARRDAARADPRGWSDRTGRARWPSHVCCSSTDRSAVGGTTNSASSAKGTPPPSGISPARCRLRSWMSASARSCRSVQGSTTPACCWMATRSAAGATEGLARSAMASRATPGMSLARCHPPISSLATASSRSSASVQTVPVCCSKAARSVVGSQLSRSSRAG